MRNAARIAALVVCLGLVMVVPAAAQSRWETQLPIVMGLAEDGLLVTVAPPTFSGCSEGEVAVNLPGMPDLDLWSGVFVADEGAPVWSLHWVLTPSGAQNITWQSNVWLRIFRLDEGDLDWYLEQPCTFYGAHAFVAEGPGRILYHSADDALEGPGVNSWGFNIQGALVDTGTCPAGTTARLFWNQKWVSKSMTDYTDAKSTASKGPTLFCR